MIATLLFYLSEGSAMRVAGFALIAAALSLGAARADVPTRLTLQPHKPSYEYGDLIWMSASLAYDAEPCPSTAVLPAVEGTLTLKRDGIVVEQDHRFFLAFDRTCANGSYTAGADFDVGGLEFGDYAFTVEYTGGGTLAPAVSAPVTVSVTPEFSAPSPTGPGRIDVGVSGDFPEIGWSCNTQLALQSQPAVLPPAGLQFPNGFIQFDFTGCSFGCGFLCPAGVSTAVRQRMLAQMPAPLPPWSTIWMYTPATPRAPETWKPIPATMHDARATFVLENPNSESELHGAVGLAVSDGPTPSLQDMWWAGSAETGWGVSVLQNGDRLFAALFVYNADGTPQWFVMPGGAWDATRTAYTGNLYRPAGAWFWNYNPALFRPGDPVGSATLTFAPPNDTGTLTYTISGKSGTKSIQRLPFATATAPAVPGLRSGLWWGGADHAGWGLTIAQHDSTLFAVWFTYDPAGNVMWYVMSGGTWTTPTTYLGTLYRTTSSPWLGAAYDGQRLVTTPVGNMTLEFTGPDTARMSYSVDFRTGFEPLSREPF